MAQPVTIIGSFVSPYVRKVLAVPQSQGRRRIAVDPITPFFGNDEFERLSPLRRIPVLIDGDFAISDSLGHLRLSRRGLSRPCRCSPPTRRTAPARAGSRNMPTPGSATSSSGACSTRRSSGPMVWGEPGDEARIARGARRRTSRPRSTISRAKLPADGFLFGDIGLADIAIASFFRNAAYAGFALDAARWPRTAGWIERSLAPSRDRDPAAVRGRPAQRRDQGPAPGAARCRRAAERDDVGPARTAARENAALARSVMLVARNPMFEPGAQRAAWIR